MKPLLIVTFLFVFCSVPARVSSQSAESNITVGQTEESTEGNTDEITKISWREIPFFDRVTTVVYYTRSLNARFLGSSVRRRSSNSGSPSSRSSNSSSSSSGSSSPSGSSSGRFVSRSSSAGDSSSRRNRRSRHKRGASKERARHDAIAVTTEHNGIWLLEKGQGYATTAYSDADSYPFADTIATPFEQQQNYSWQKQAEVSTCNETIKVRDIMREGYLYQPYSTAFPNCIHAARSMWGVVKEICNASKIENAEVMTYDGNAPLQSILDMYMWRLSTATKVCLKIMLILQQDGIDASMICYAAEDIQQELGMGEVLFIEAEIFVPNTLEI